MTAMRRTVYTLSYSSQNADIEVRLNDLYVGATREDGEERGQVYLNSCIACSGEQKLTWIVEQRDSDDESSKAAELNIDVARVCLETDNMNVVEYKTVFSTHLEGDDVIDGQSVFEADVQYCIDLGLESEELPQQNNIEEMVLDVYRKWNRLTDEGRYREVVMMLDKHDSNDMDCHYWTLTEEERRQRIEDFEDILSSGFRLVMPEEEDKLVYYGNGRLVRYVRPDGTGAFVLRNDDGDEYPMNIYMYRPIGRNGLEII